MVEIKEEKPWPAGFPAEAYTQSDDVIYVRTVVPPPVDNSQNYLVKGDVQSGKTRAMYSLIKEAVQLFECWSVVITRNSIKDKNWMIHNLRQNEDSIVPYGLDNKMLWLVKPSPLVVMANQTQLTKVIDDLDGEFVLFIDEADLLLKSDCPTRTEIMNLHHKAQKTVMVTATSHTILRSRIIGVPPQNIFTIPPSRSYRSVNDLIHVKLPENVISKPEYNLTEPVGEGDYIAEYLSHLSTQRVSVTHPIILLYRNSLRITDQFFLLEYLKSIGDKTWFAMEYNSEGIYVYRHGIGSPLPGKNGTQSSDHIWHFRGISVQEVLQVLKNTGNVSHILIISGFLAGRSISFTSIDREWHLTHQYLLARKTTQGANLLQSLRCCGVYNDLIPITLVCTQTVYGRIKEQYEKESNPVNNDAPILKRTRIVK